MGLTVSAIFIAACFVGPCALASGLASTGCMQICKNWNETEKAVYEPNAGGFLPPYFQIKGTENSTNVLATKRYEDWEKSGRKKKIWAKGTVPYSPIRRGGRKPLSAIRSENERRCNVLWLGTFFVFWGRKITAPFDPIRKGIGNSTH